MERYMILLKPGGEELIGFSLPGVPRPWPSSGRWNWKRERPQQALGRTALGQTPAGAAGTHLQKEGG